MSFLSVGIIENLHVGAKTKMNDKGTMSLHLKTKMDDAAVMAAFGGEGSIESADSELLMFGPNMKDFDQNAKDYMTMSQELMGFKNVFKDILMIYMTSEKAEAAINPDLMFRGTGVDASTMKIKLTQEVAVKAIYTNICNAFISAITPFMESDSTFRMKLTRQSKAKHFPMIVVNKKFPETWIEPMLVAKEQSKIKWSKWEIEHGKNDATPVATDDAPKNEADQAAAMFGSAVAPVVASTTAAPIAAPIATPVVEDPIATVQASVPVVGAKDAKAGIVPDGSFDQQAPTPVIPVQ